MLNCRIIGWYNKNNIGDESYKISFPQLFPQLDFDFDGDSRRRSEYDVCILGGGDILNEHYARKALACPAKKRFIVSTSAGPMAPLDLLPKFDGIYIRDRRSERFLSEKGIECTFLPDVSTCLQPNKEQGIEWLESKFRSEGLDLYEKRIGLVLNAHLMYAKDGILARDFITFLKAAQDMARLADNTSASFVLLPMSTQMPYDDRIPNGFVASRCKFWKKNLLVQDRLTVQETLNLISACDAIISTRLHSSIFSLNSQVPFVDIVHHDKNRSFLETMQLEGQALSYWSFCFEELRSAVEMLLDDHEAHVRKLEWIYQQNLEALKREAGDVRLTQ